LEAEVKEMERDRARDPNHYWKAVKRLLGQERTMPQVVDWKGRKVCDKAGRMEAWAGFFEELGRPSEKAEFDEAWRRAVEAEIAEKQQDPQQQLELDGDITVAEVAAVIEKMAAAKAGGCDGVLPFMLKRGGEGMVAGLRRLLQVVWEQEAVPADWKRGQLVPIFKGGTESALGDYRGITLMSVVGKVLEGVVLARIEKWMEKAGGLSDAQGGFRAGRGTADLIWLVSEVIQRRRELKQRSFVCFVDVQKAYDTVWQAGLWKRLWDVGVRGKAWRLLQEWYRGSTSSVLVDGEETRAFELQQGVKQGCVLSPVLYAVFVDGVVEELRRRGLGVVEEGVWVGVVLYADDMALLARSQEELEKMMAVVVEYSRRWRFGLNAGKTKCWWWERRRRRERRGQAEIGCWAAPRWRRWRCLNTLVWSCGEMGSGRTWQNGWETRQARWRAFCWGWAEFARGWGWGCGGGFGWHWERRCCGMARRCGTPARESWRASRWCRDRQAGEC
jgi:hypothetical protein